MYALQGGVSRKNAGKDHVGDYGQGTADLIEFFQELGQTAGAEAVPKMCVLSGHTIVQFDGRYCMQRVENELGVWRIIAFNKENSLDLPPDPESVRHLPSYFPGTLISMRFYLDPEYLHAIPAAGAGRG